MIQFLLAAAIFGHQTTVQSGYIRTISRTDGVAVSQTEACRLTAAGKPDVWLVGASHIGAKDYYANLQALLDAQDVVLFEGVRSKTRSMTPPKADPKAPKALYQVFSDAIGLDFQLVDIRYDNPKWVNSDLTMEQLDQLNKKAGKGKPTDFDMVMKMLDPNSMQAKFIAEFFKTATPSMKEALKIFMLDQIGNADKVLANQVDPGTVNILLHARNVSVEQAFEKAVATTPPPKSIGIFYGALHQIEIQKALAAKFGYKPVEQRWFTFAQANRTKLDESGKQFLNMFESMLKGR